MPEICRFYGLIIKLYHDDHPPPHIHVEYGEHEALLRIDSLSIIAGRLPSRALGLVMEWMALHQSELLLLWEKARNLEPLDKIAPLP